MFYRFPELLDITTNDEDRLSSDLRFSSKIRQEVADSTTSLSSLDQRTLSSPRQHCGEATSSAAHIYTTPLIGVEHRGENAVRPPLSTSFAVLGSTRLMSFVQYVQPNSVTDFTGKQNQNPYMTGMCYNI